MKALPAEASDEIVENRQTKWLSWLLLAYVFLSPFTRIFYLPYVYAKIQPTELLFLVLFPLALAVYGRQLIPDRRWVLPIAIYLLVNLAAGLQAWHLDAILESLGRIYLAVLFAIVAAYVHHRGIPGAKAIGEAWFWGGFVLALLSLAGYLLSQITGHPNELVRVYGNYPYLGTIVRAAGLTGGPGMLAVVLAFPMLYAWRGWRLGRRSPIFFMLFGVVLLLTFSKGVLLIGLGLLWVDPLSQHVSKTLKWSITVGVALVFWLATHIIFLRASSVQESYLSRMQYTSQQSIGQLGSVQLVETTYLHLKKANYYVGRQHPWLGVGPGRFKAQLPKLREEGRYAAHLPSYEPHSTWWGSFSETGVLGLLATLLLAGGFLFAISKHYSLLSRVSVLHCLSIFLLFLLLNSDVMDSLNFRHLWLSLGVLAGGILLQDKGLRRDIHLEVKL